MLVTILGAVNQPCVCEIAIGSSFQEVLSLAGGTSAPLQALLLGGYYGSWVDAAAAETLPFSSAGLAVLGAGVGAGLIAALPQDACGLVETARVVRYLADQSARQCGPCLFGLDAIAGELSGSLKAARPISACCGAGSARLRGEALVAILTAW